MKRDFSKHGHRERIDKVDKKSAFSGAVVKEKSTKRRLSIYDDFDEEDLDDFDFKSFKNSKFK
jgi:hypothetical protein